MKLARNIMRLYFLQLLSISFLALLLIGCSKTIDRPEVVTPVNAPSPAAIGINFRVSQSQLTLLQDNAKNTILNLSWDVSNGTLPSGTLYSLEFSLVEFDFLYSAIIDSTTDNHLEITVEHLNKHMSELIEAGFSDMVKLRIRAESPLSKNPVYSNPVAISVTTYQNFTNYIYPQVIHIPGNFENWKVITAPDIISKANDGEYEGYVNFTTPYPQFLMVKGDDWDPFNTFYDIGANKFGFGGNIFSVKGGTGVYQMRFSTNTNSWKYTKINSWEIFGSALPDSFNVDHVMKFNPGTVSWTITLPMVKGKFRIRANDGNTISFGHIHSEGYMIPDYNGDDFEIESAGLYTVTLNLSKAGNYGCSVIKKDPNHS